MQYATYPAKTTGAHRICGVVHASLKDRERPVTVAARGRAAWGTRRSKGASPLALDLLCVLNCVARASFTDSKIIFRCMYSLCIYYISGTSPHTRQGLSHSILFHLQYHCPFYR